MNQQSPTLVQRWGVGGAVGAVVLIFTLSASSSVGATTLNGGSASAPSNVQTALTASKTYYLENGESYTGLDPTTFAALGTGLKAVDGTTHSSGPGVISLLASNTYVVLAAWGSGKCWSIIDITDSTTLEGFTGPGTIYVTSPDVTKGKCSAATFNSTSAIPGAVVSTSGFPPPP